MAVLQTSYPSADVIQKEIYNTNLGGQLNLRAEFSVPAGISWAVVGTVLVDAATPADVTSTLIPAIEALAQVTSVNGDQVWGQIPSTIQMADHECKVHVTSRMTMQIGTTDVFSQVIENYETIKPPVNKKWCIFVLRVPSALNDSAITALESAIEGITGVTTCEHLIDGTVSSRASAGANLVINVHMRIDPIEV